MKQKVLHKCFFIGKSLLWSGALYVTLMLALNWDDVRNTFNNNHASVVSSGMPSVNLSPKALPATVPSKISAGFEILQTAGNVIVEITQIISRVTQ